MLQTTILLPSFTYAARFETSSSAMTIHLSISTIRTTRDSAPSSGDMPTGSRTVAQPLHPPKTIHIASLTLSLSGSFVIPGHPNRVFHTTPNEHGGKTHFISLFFFFSRRTTRLILCKKFFGLVLRFEYPTWRRSRMG
jgi:hypothetical protein